jgi:carbon monoxide dehydrogenase subunit G
VELTNEFEVSASPERAWEVLSDLEVVVPCLPGAQLEGMDGDDFKGSIRVKVGSVTASYSGRVRFVERDRDAGRLVLDAAGKGTRGQGTAKAIITAQLTPRPSGGTAVAMVTDMAVTGMVAQFGRGVMADVSRRLIDRFAAALEERMVVGDATGGAPSATLATAPAPTPFPVSEDAGPEALELGSLAGAAVARRVAWLGLALAAAAVLLWLILQAFG